MSRKYRLNTFLGLVILMGVGLLSCGRINGPLRMDTDEEAELFDKKYEEKIKDRENLVKDIKKEIATKEVSKDNLGENNRCLKNLKKDKSPQVEAALREMREDVRKGKDLIHRGEVCTISVECEKCHKHATLEYSKLIDLVKNYREGCDGGEEYTWAMWWEWNRHKEDNFVVMDTFKRCIECMDESHVTYFEKKIRENANKLSELEAELVHKRAQLNLVEVALDENKESKCTVAHQSERRKHFREEASKEREKAEKAERELEKKLEEMKQSQIEMAEMLLKAGVSREEVLTVTKLKEEDLGGMGAADSDLVKAGGSREEVLTVTKPKEEDLDSVGIADSDLDDYQVIHHQAIQ